MGFNSGFKGLKFPGSATDNATSRGRGDIWSYIEKTAEAAIRAGHGVLNENQPSTDTVDSSSKCPCSKRPSWQRGVVVRPPGAAESKGL